MGGRAIKSILGKYAFPRVQLDVSKATWAATIDKAFGKKLNPPFDPYCNSLNYLISTYTIPYVGLTGYVGTNPLLSGMGAKSVSHSFSLWSSIHVAIKQCHNNLIEVEEEKTLFLISIHLTKLVEIVGGCSQLLKFRLRFLVSSVPKQIRSCVRWYGEIVKLDQVPGSLVQFLDQ